MREGLQVERRLTARRMVLTLSGALSIDAVGTADAVLSHEIEAADRDVCLDLSALQFIGFAGLDLLVDLSHRLAAHSRRLEVTATNPTLDRILDVAGVHLTVADGDHVFVPTRPASRVPVAAGRCTRDTTPMQRPHPTTTPAST